MAIPYSQTIVAGIPWYSVLIVTGILLAIFVDEREEKRLALPKDTVIDLALISVPCGIVGARLYYVAMTWDRFVHHPLSILYIWEGGVAFYGALIGGALGLLCYAKRKKLPCLRLMDALIPGVLLAQAIGRWGNYFNMEAYGPEIQNKLFQFFPAGVLIPSEGGYRWHMATFFYESLWNFCSFLGLWALRKHQRKEGNVFFWYLILYGSGRFIIEQLREDSLYLAGFRISQMLSLALCGVAATVLLWRSAEGRHRPFLIALGSEALLIARWFFVSTPWSYWILALAGVGVGAFVFQWKDKEKWKKYLLWLGLPFLLDMLGLCFSCVPTPLLSFAGRVHILICSLTLPFFTGGLITLLSTDEIKEG